MIVYCKGEQQREKSSVQIIPKHAQDAQMNRDAYPLSIFSTTIQDTTTFHSMEVAACQPRPKHVTTI
jgi:hypothetical protein